MVKKAAYGLLAAFLAAGVYGDIPTTAEGWYTPSGGFAAQSGTGTIYYGYDRATGQWQTAEVEVDEQGNISTPFESLPSDVQRNHDLRTAYQALTKALGNEAYNAVQDEAIQTIGKNLHALTSKDGIHIRNENTGQEFTIKFGGSIASAVSGSTGDIHATSDAEDPTDKKSIDWTGNGKLELKGWAEQDASGSFWDSSPGPVGVPVRTGYGGAAMAYRNWYGVDNLSLAPNPGTHKLELKGWDTGAESLTPLAEAIKKPAKGPFDDYKLVVRNSGKGLNYVSLGTLDMSGEDVASGACSQKWEKVVSWIGDSAAITADGRLTLPDDSLDEHLYGSLGYIYSTTPGNLHFDNDGGEIHASFTAPENWADGGSIELTGDGQYQIKGFSYAEASGASVSAMLSNPSGSDARSYLLLAKETDSGELHYVPIGQGVKSGAEPDNHSITTNTANGVLSISGFASANDGTMAVKQNGSIVWNKTPPNIKAGRGINITSNDVEQTVSHNLVAGAGIYLSNATGSALQISTMSPGSPTVVDPHAQELTFITELWYDNAAHQIKAKRRTAKVMFIGTVPAEESFIVLQCSPHSAEHDE